MFISKKLAMFISAAALPVLVATAQEAPKGAGGPAEGAGGPPPPPHGFNRGGMGRIMPGGPQASGLIFARMLGRPEFIQGLGLPDEVVTKLTEGLKKIDEQEKAVRDELEKLRRAQAEALATLMSDRTKTGDDIREGAKKVDELQGKLFGLGIDRMLLIRDNLTDEQIKQASELVKKNFESRREEMMKRRGGPDGQRWRGPRDGGRRGPPEGGPKDAPKDGPKDAPKDGPKDAPKDGPKDAPPPPPPPPEAPKAE